MIFPILNDDDRRTRSGNRAQRLRLLTDFLAVASTDLVGQSESPEDSERGFGFWGASPDRAQNTMGGNRYEMSQQHSGDDPSRHITGSKRGDPASLEVLFRSVTPRRDGDLPNDKILPQ